MHRAAVILIGAVLILPGAGAAAGTLPEAALEPGPFPVGFRSSIARDPGRGYPDDARARGQGQRPILLAVWYPATPKPSSVRMKHGEYFDVKVGTPADAQFVERLGRFGRDVLAREVLDVAAEFTSDADARALEGYLGSATLAIRDAPGSPGKFPLVIHHPGLGAAFADQTPLLEQLASHGYVVVTSAFQPSDPQTVAIDGDLYRSAADVEFILSQLRRDPQVDPDRVAMMGHSFGGIASMATAMRNPLITGVVCLDSTLDYHRSAQLPLDQLDLRIFREPDRLLVPTLAFARPHARFDLLRSFKRADRTLVKIKVVDHNSFLWHGPAGALLRGEPGAADRLTAYRTLALWTRRFLDAWLKKDVAAAALLASAPGGRDGVTLERLPAPDAGGSMMQVVAGVVSRGPGEGVAWLEGFAQQVGSERLNDLTSALEERGHGAEALAVARMNARLNPDDFAARENLGGACARRKAWPEAQTALREALRLLQTARIKAPDRARARLQQQLQRVDAILKQPGPARRDNFR